MPRAARFAGGDPRDATRVHEYQMKQVEDPMNPYSFFAMILALGGMMLGWKPAFWGGIICTVAAFANSRVSEGETSQVFMSLAFHAMGFMKVYLQGPRKQAASS